MYKKFILFLCLLLPILYICPKDKVLDINGEKITIAIPENITEKIFIDVVKSYLETKSNLEEAEKDSEVYEKDIIELKNQLTKTEKLLSSSQVQMNSLYLLLENRPKKTVTIFRPNIILGMEFNLDKQINANLGIGVTLFEWVNLGLLVQMPELSFGFLITIYISK